MKWYPHPRQIAALERIEFEILYGGARGGGKTDAGLVWLTDHIDNPQYRALVIRKNADDLSDWVDRSIVFYKGLGAMIAYRPAVIKFPSGAVIRTGHLKDDQAYTKYQGHEYQRILIEELTQIPDEKRYLQLLASCRSTVGGIKAQVFATTNPGGPGHLWVKERFVDPSPPNTAFKDTDSGRTRIYIPALVDDNPTLADADPDYVRFLDGLKAVDEELWKAWRLGNWDVFAGMFFKEFRRNTHVINSFIPNSENNVIIGGLDWGYNAPFSFHATEVSRRSNEGTTYFRAKTFLEVYANGKHPTEAANMIVEALKFYTLTLGDFSSIQADPAMFNRTSDGSVSIRDQFVNTNDGFRKIREGSNDRLPGWAIMHNWLSIAPDGVPYYQITNNCVNLIREMGNAIYDEKKIEELDAESDHALDDQRYMLKSLKWIDAKVGAVKENKADRDDFRTKMFAPMGDGGQLSIDTSKFK